MFMAVTLVATLYRPHYVVDSLHHPCLRQQMAIGVQSVLLMLRAVAANVAAYVAANSYQLGGARGLHDRVS